MEPDAALARTWAQPWSAVAVVKITGPLPSFAGLIFCDVQSTSGVFTGYEQWIDYQGYLRVRVMQGWNGSVGSGNYIDLRGSRNMADSLWHTIGASYDGSGTPGGVAMYVDGVGQAIHQPSELGSPGTSQLTGTPAPPVGPMAIGDQLGGVQNTYYLPGSMRGIAFSNVVKPAAWFAPSGDIPAIDSTIMGAWDFAATSGATVPDASGNGNVITLASASMFSAT